MKEALRENQTSAHISPSNNGESMFIAINPHPLDIQREGPTEEDKYLANSQIPTLETAIADFVKGNEGTVSTRTAVCIGAGGILVGGIGGYFFAKEVFANPSASSVGIDSFTNSFNQEQPKINPKEVFDNNAEKGVIGLSNIVRISQEEIDKLPKDDENGNPVYLFPLVLGEEVNLRYDRDHPTRVRLHEVKAPMPIIAAHDGFALALRPLVKEVDGRVVPASSGRARSIEVTFKGPDGNAHMIDVNTGANMANPNLLLNSLDKIPSLGPENSNGRDFTKGLPVKRGDVLGYVDEGINLLQIHAGTKRMRGNQIYINPSPQDVAIDTAMADAMRLNFVALRDNKSGSPKISIVDSVSETLSK